MRAVVLVIALAILAFQARRNLSANTNTVANLDGRHLVTNFDGFPNDLVSDTKGQWGFSPATGDAVDVGTANTAGVDLDVDITVTERLCLELHRDFEHMSGLWLGVCAHLLFLEVTPLLVGFNHEPLKGVWVSHLEC